MKFPMKTYANNTHRIASRHSGAALVITLAMLILVSFVVVAFLGRSTREAVLVGGTIGGQKAEILANSAAETIIADLKNEMRAESTEITIDGVTIMEPSSASTVFPGQNRLLATTGTVFDNLIKQSGASGGMFSASSTNKLISAATTTPTTTASVDGRKVSEDRWNAPKLLVDGNFTATNVPNWVLVDRLGVASSQTWNNLFRDSRPTNDRFIVGRFAYNIYDVSGLLDINVAGYPNSVTTADSARKGNLAMAALENIPGITSAANASLFVKDWRNKVTGTTATNFLSFLGLGNATDNAYYNFGPKYGFQKVANSASDSDNRILSRQDLIKLATNDSNGISTAALPYLTHFSRAVSAPSWSPATPAGSSTNYNADRNKPGSANRFLANVRVSGNFTRADGTTAQIGEPLLKTRFPLSRLAGLGRTGVNATGNTTIDAGVAVSASVATVQRDFGLFWSSDRWNYAGPSGSAAQSAIKTLAQVTSDNREPNFFELLKASILSGSLGKSLGVTQVDTVALDQSQDNQIIQIGLNIIDQYDADSYPTRITFNSNDFAGIENLPYLSRVFSHFYRLKADPTANCAYWMAEVWNPHRPKTNADGPTRFRFAAEGTSVFYTVDSGVRKNNLSNLITHAINDAGTPEFVANAANASFANPTLLLPVYGASAKGDNFVPEGPVNFVGIYVGRVESLPNTGGAYLLGNPHESFFLQYQDGANWVSYQVWTGNKWVGLADANGNKSAGTTISPAMYTGGADPRSTRFGIIGNYCHDRRDDAPAWNSATGEDSLYKTLRHDSSQNGAGLWVTPAIPSGNGWGPATLPKGPDKKPTYRFGVLAENIDPDDPNPSKRKLANGSPSPLGYRDNDNILRNGDAAYASGAWGQPLEQADTAKGLASRPLMLDRPFRSVGEMGYAFRDLPYKSLDFFTANSGDAALLDTFCLNESPASGVTAGVINLNTRHRPVLKAVLAGVLKDELDTTSVLAATTEAEEVAKTLTSVTAAAPLLNRSELATRVSPALTVTSFANNPADATIKARRESVVRALADVSNTRTWNLLVDLVMQSGRYPNSATAVDKFSVDGERRYWLHLAIDRYTGQVVARSMEPVNE
jgi:Tfp pilus assembly protein PilX